MPIDTREYNIKGIYGMNGSGKSAIISSVNILRGLLVYEDYLNNPVPKIVAENYQMDVSNILNVLDQFIPQPARKS